MAKRMAALGLLVASALAPAAGCLHGHAAPDDETRSGPRAQAEDAPVSAAEPAGTPAPLVRAVRREGSVIARAPDVSALYIADEDHAALRRVQLPVDVRAEPEVLYLHERPAQVLPLAERVLVTLRDPGALLVVGWRDGRLRALGRVSLPADAWGVAVTPDEQVALVTSAWTHQVSAVSLRTMQRLWSVDVAREPRAVVVSEDGRSAYVSHLVGADLTRIVLPEPGADDGVAPQVTRVPLPAAPLWTRYGDEGRMGASLGYSAVLSPDGGRLFVARHALGALGRGAWQGVPTVDVLRVADEQPEQPARRPPAMVTPYAQSEGHEAPIVDHYRDRAGQLPLGPVPSFVQPRAMIYRRHADTLLVASEGRNTVVELEVLSTDPATAVRATYALGQGYDQPLGEPEEGRAHVATRCSAPSGIALSEDEETAFVFCRGSYDLAIVSLEDRSGPIPLVRLAAEPLDAEQAAGRRMFYDAEDPVISGGMGCAGCHPEGRDDGFVWREIDPSEGETPERSHMLVTTAALFASFFDGHRPDALPRQTPMLAGRVDQRGRYGVHGRALTLQQHIQRGFELHRWGERADYTTPQGLSGRARRLAAFLRSGLVPPPRRQAPLSAQQKRGQLMFSSERAQCSQCHLPERGYGHDERVAWLDAADEAVHSQPTGGARWKVPSLRFVSGTAPYLHDGRAATLQQLLAHHPAPAGSRPLSRADRAALIAFLETL